jgi:hypothetical protein
MNTNAGVFGESTGTRRGSSGASLYYSIAQFPGDARYWGVHVPLCSSSSMNLMGKTISAWIYIDGTELPSCGSLHDLSLRITNTNGMVGNAVSRTPVYQQWFQVTGTVSLVGAQTAMQLDVALYLSCDTTWIGSVYIDDVTIGG